MEIVEGDLGKWRILDRISNEILQGERKKKKKRERKRGNLQEPQDMRVRQPAHRALVFYDQSITQIRYSLKLSEVFRRR